MKIGSVSSRCRVPLIVGIGGTTRPGSATERMVAAILAAASDQGARTRLFGGVALRSLPHYAPENPERTVEQNSLVDAVRLADGIVIATPSYHGGVSGLVKNALDLLEDLRDDERPYLDGRAIGLVVMSAGWQAGGGTLSALRNIAHALRGWPTPVGIAINTVAQKPFDADGLLNDIAVAEQVRLMARQVMQDCSTDRSTI